MNKVQNSNPEVLVNVVPDSTNGHFLTNCKVEVINEELGIRFATPLSGDVVLKTENHATVVVNESKPFTTFQQMEVDHFRDLVQKARD